MMTSIFQQELCDMQVRLGSALFGWLGQLTNNSYSRVTGLCANHAVLGAFSPFTSAVAFSFTPLMSVLLSIRRWLSTAGRVWGLRADHFRPFPDEGQWRVLAPEVPSVRCVPATAHRHLLLQRHKAVLQERLPTVRTLLCIHGLGLCGPSQPVAQSKRKEYKLGCFCLFEGAFYANLTLSTFYNLAFLLLFSPSTLFSAWKEGSAFLFIFYGLHFSICTLTPKRCLIYLFLKGVYSWFIK